jgi:hypothetical protein
MPGGIWQALGAALQSGSRTFGQLNEDELQRKEREQARADRLAEMQHRDQFESRRLDMEQKGQDLQEKERQARILSQAIEGMSPDSVAPEELVGKIKDVAPELLARFNPKLDIQSNVTSGVGNVLDSLGKNAPQGPTGAPAMSVSQKFVRNPTLEESAAMDTLARGRKSDKDKDAFEQWMATEGAGKSYDERATKAASMGLPAPPKLFKDREAEEDADFKRRQKELAIMYPPDRFGPKTQPKSPQAQWLTAYNTVEDNVRQKYGAQLNALAKASADGMEGADEKLQALEERIGTEAMSLATKIMGPMPTVAGAPAETPKGDAPPNADATQHLMSTLDTDVHEYGGDYNKMLKDVLANQAKLRQAGVDVKSYIRAINSRAQGLVKNNPIEDYIQNESAYAGRIAGGANSAAQRAATATGVKPGYR